MMRNKVLVVAGHPDDEVLGCGGTIARHVGEGDEVHVMIMADGVTSRGEGHSGSGIEDRKKAANEAGRILGTQFYKHLEYPDNRMDTVPLLSIVQVLENFIKKIEPRIVYTHHGGDLNVDHRITYQAVMTACRPQPGQPVREIYSFEVLSSTEWALPYGESTFIPNRFVDITETMKQKMKAMRAYHAEMKDFPHSRSYEAIEALACYRGNSVGVPAAEAFRVERLLR